MLKAQSNHHIHMHSYEWIKNIVTFVIFNPKRLLTDHQKELKTLCTSKKPEQLSLHT